MRLVKRLKKHLFAPVLETKARRISAELEPFIVDASRALDFGCGDMVLTKRMSERFPALDITGLDVVDTNLMELEPTLYDGTRVPFPDGHFDVAWAVFALHHCSDELGALREIRRVTRGRVLIIEETYASRLSYLVTCAHDWVTNRVESLSVPIPFHFRTDEEWRRAFAELGYRVSEERRVYQVPALNLTRQRLYVLDPIATSTTVPSRAMV